MMLAFSAGCASGWQIAVWARNSEQLLIDRAAAAAGNKAMAEMQALSSSASRQLEEKLEGLKNAMSYAIRTEMAKGVFNTACFSDDFVRMYNTASTRAERTLSGKPENPLPGQHAPPGGQ